MRHIVRTPSGKIFTIAAEIAAMNKKAMMSPGGKILIPEPASKFGEMTGEIDGRKLDYGSEEYVNSPEEMKYGSEGDYGEAEGEGEDGNEEGEEWLGKDEGFWKQPVEKERVVRSRRQRRKDKSS